MSKRSLTFLMIIILVLVPLSSMAATSQAPAGTGLSSVPGPTGTFSSAFTVQNMAPSIATCSYKFINTAGAIVFTSATFTIPVGGSNFTYVPSIAALANGQYSGVVSCDQQVSAIVNTGSANSGGSYGGVSTTSTTWYAPNAYKNYYNYYTNFVVQNASTGPVDVTVQIINSTGGVVATQTLTGIPPLAYRNIEQSGLAALSQNVSYSAKITGTGQLAVESNIYGQASAVNQLYSYVPFSSGSTTAYAPVIMKDYYGYLTALTVQNIGTASATVTVTYGTGLVQSQVIAQNSSYVFFTPSTSLPNGTLTSAKITSTQNIVALVNEQNNYGRAASYTAFASGSTKVSVPIVMKRYYGYNTSVTCQNVGTSATNMTILYSNAATTTLNSIPANGTALFYQPTTAGLPNGFNGSATITSSSQPIVCVTNEDMNEAPAATTTYDQLFTYEGFPVP